MQIEDPARCKLCRERFTSSDEVTSGLTNTPDGEAVVRQFWHARCWERHVDEVRNCGQAR
jgi:hypothetical protein